MFSFHLWLSLPVFSPQYSFSQAYVCSDNLGCIFVLKPFSLEPSTSCSNASWGCQAGSYKGRGLEAQNSVCRLISDSITSPLLSSISYIPNPRACLIGFIQRIYLLSSMGMERGNLETYLYRPSAHHLISSSSLFLVSGTFNSYYFHFVFLFCSVLFFLICFFSVSISDCFSLALHYLNV